jgi:ribosomal protein L19
MMAVEAKALKANARTSKLATQSMCIVESRRRQGPYPDLQRHCHRPQRQWIGEMFTVRRMVGEEGVERIFPAHSPNIDKVVPVRSGKTRRAKLFYLRKRTGKGVKLAQRHSSHTTIR